MPLQTRSVSSIPVAGKVYSSVRILVLALAVAIAKLWLWPAGAGLWLDETGSYWAIQGGWGEIHARTIQWPAQVPLYSYLLWIAHKLPLPLEWGLRLPSLLAMAGSLLLLFRLGRRLLNPEAAWIAVILAACFHPLYFAAADARPYACAVLFSLASTDRLVSWMENRRTRDAALYGLLAALTLHMHYAFGTVLLVHVAYVVAVDRSSRAGWGGQVLAAALAFGAATAPLVPHFRAMLATRAGRAFAGPPSLPDLFASLAPAEWVAVGGGLLLAALAIHGRPGWRARIAPRASWTLIALLALLPTFLAFAVSAANVAPVFIPRYLLPSALGLALAAGWAVSCASPAAQRWFAVGVVASAILSSPDGVRHVRHGGDYREAAEALHRSLAANPSAEVLFRIGFSETAIADWTSASQRTTPYFRAVLDAYPLGAEPIQLPYQANAGALSYLESLLPRLRKAPRIFVLESFDGAYDSWLTARLGPDGYSVSKTQPFGTALRLTEFERSGPVAGER